VSISVYSQQQDLTTFPAHEVTRRLSILLLKAGLARQVGQAAIQLTSDLAWSQLKKLARANIDPLFIKLSPMLALCDYPEQRTCMAEAFQRCMRYPVELAKDQRSFRYSFDVPQPSPTQPLCA
jgi:hypothetical protein